MPQICFVITLVRWLFLPFSIVLYLECSRTFSGRSGRLSSPLYPSYYPDNTKCIYTIVAPTKEDVIQLSFANFDLQSDAQCQQDYIQIYDGDSVTSPLLSNDNNNSSTGGRLCGNTLPSTVLSSGQTLTIKFHSDGKVNRPGYMANWRAVTSSKGKCLIHQYSIVD